MTPKDALIEKMARAMLDCRAGENWRGEPITWDNVGNESRDYWRDIARAAYEAEHEEPTPTP